MTRRRICSSTAGILLRTTLGAVSSDQATQDPKPRQTLEKLQDPQNGGLWRTVLDDPVADGSYAEASALARYPTCTRKGAGSRRTGMQRPLSLGWRRECCDEHCLTGEVTNVSVGTVVGDTIDCYMKIAKIQTT